MFAYCENDPVNRSDATGEFAHLVIGAAVGAAIGGITAAISSYRETGSVNLGSVLLGVGVGAANGLIGASGMGAVAQALWTGALGFSSNIASSLIQGTNVNIGDAFLDGVIGAGASVLGSTLTKKATGFAKKYMQKGAEKLFSANDRRIAGDRFWKGEFKKGLRICRDAYRGLTQSRMNSSIIGSASGGAVMNIKNVFLK